MWYITEIDIPGLSDGIEFGSEWCFKFIYHIQSSSTISVVSLIYDAPSLESFIRSRWWYA